MQIVDLKSTNSKIIVCTIYKIVKLVQNSILNKFIIAKFFGAEKL